MSQVDSPSAGARRGRRRGWVVVRRVLAVLLSLVLIAGVAGFFYYRHLEGNIDTLPSDPRHAGRAEPKPTEPLNILLLGSDQRVAGGGVSGVGGDLADTTILFHLSADRSRAYGVSIPRDLLVDRPRCAPKESGGAEVRAARSVQFNTAFQVGGPNCTWRTVESMTGMRVDHVVVVKFDGFKRMVDALGGVPVCVPKAVDDDAHDIHLRAGSYDISGNNALTYVRARYGIGDGSDIGRIRRQQAFLAAMVNKAASLGTLVDPRKLFPFLEAVTSSVQTDESLAKLSKLVRLARQVKDIGLGQVKFLTMPIAIPTDDPNRRIPGPGAAALWRQIRSDQPLTRAQLGGSITAAQPPDGKPGKQGKPGKSPGKSPSPSGAPTSEDQERAAVGLCA